MVSSAPRRIVTVFLPIGVLLLALALAPTVSGWGSSVHHDQAITISDALVDSPSIPGEVRENFDSDTIYNASLAPDDWRDATGVAGTWQYNMAENAYYEFQRIRNAWANGDFDNAIFRIGMVLHYVGDAMEMEHNSDLRQYYYNYVEPIGSYDPLWSDEESGGLYAHHVHQQMEAYTDSDSVWYPRGPESYGTTDNGSLDWFLDYFYNPAIDNDNPDGDYGTVIGRHIRETSPSVSSPTGGNNRWFNWVESRDPDISKMDADNAIRLTYNGVYRALRDGEYWRQYGAGAGTPADWSYWPWPTSSAWQSPRTYGEGYDSIRRVEGLTQYGSSGGEPGQEAAGQGGAEMGVAQILLLLVGSVAAAIGALYAWRRWRDREARPALKGGVRRRQQ